ncbi:MAG TPA: porin family protein [Fibrobacteria bacterium]|nr:porin family protein [Fibrobacteria bacterium]
MFRAHTSRPVRYLLLAGLALAPATVSAALSFGMGPIGGMNFGNAGVDNHENTDGRQGLALGGRAEFGVTNPYSLVVEGTYVQKGARFDVLGVTTRGDFDYVEIPILLKAKFGAIKAHAFAFAGPSVGINVNTEGKFASLNGDFKDESASVVFSGDVGVGGEFQVMPFVYLSGDVRYSHGFTNALDDSVGDIDEWKSRDIRAMVGLLFHLTE